MTLQEKYLAVINKKDLYPKLWAVQWEESERGWGCRPDGFSFHKSEQDAFQFIKEYQDRLPKEVPDEYSRPVGKPVLAEVSYDLY